MAPPIVVEHLSVSYGARVVLSDVSLSVAGGSVLSVIGPSGCGKSTFLRVLNRLVDREPAARVAGRVWVGDVDVLGPQVDLVRLRRRVGMVFQDPNPFPFSIYDNVAYGPRLHGERSPVRLRAIVEDSLRQAALWDAVRGKLRHPASTLSGGEQQRLCIARALAVQPEVLLMDEPTSALDPGSSERIEELVSALRGRYTIILVTHNLQQAGRVSDVTAFLEGGRLIEMGETSMLFTAPRVARTEQYLTGRLEG